MSQSILKEARRWVGSRVEGMYRQLPEPVATRLRLLMYEVLSYYYYGDGDMPLTVGIETTAVCNRRCEYCPVHIGSRDFIKLYRNEVRAMPCDLYQFILLQLRLLPRWGKSKGFIGNLYLNGFGEPLLDPDIVERVGMARKFLPDASIILPSNGDKLTPDLLNDLIGAGLTQLLLTPHDPSGRLSQEWIHKEAANNPYIQIREPLARLFNRGGTVYINPDKRMRPESACVAPTFSMIIDANGAIVPCSNDPYQTMSMGNVRDWREGTLYARWRGDAWTEHRRNLRRGDWSRTSFTCQACHNDE